MTILLVGERIYYKGPRALSSEAYSRQIIRTKTPAGFLEFLIWFNDIAFAPGSVSGRELRSIGIDPYSDEFHTINLMDPDKVGGTWNKEDARSVVKYIRLEIESCYPWIILLGRRVVRAFGLQSIKAPSIIPKFFIFPHPAGRGAWHGEKGQMRSMLRGVI